MRDLGIPKETTELLQQYRFDADKWLELQRELQLGRFPADRNRLTGTVSAPPREAITAWPEGRDREALERQGRAAIEAGQVASVVLNGGMATRFGGQVKGAVEVLPGRSFLALKLAPYARLNVPVFLMNSFATDAATRTHLGAHAGFGIPAGRLFLVTQKISLRLTPQGDLFRDQHGAPSPYAPGHGDLFEVLAESAAFSAFVESGGRYVLVSNVDNLGATLSPLVIGAHIALGRPITVEVAERLPHDSGGAPALVDGRLAIVEGFRFPNDFAADRLPVFNTNTLMLDARCARATYPLTWFRADKTVDQQPVVQFERLFGEVTSFEPSTFLRVPRSGPEGRFLPVKTPDDLVGLRSELLARRLDQT